MPNRQRGVAVIMALLLTTLAITIVASLFWQQQVQVRLIENQRLQLQKQWILRGALDWASLILREDAKYSSVDTLDEPWATPLAETRLDQYVENGKADGDIADTTLSGTISDAQGRFNLNNLVQNGVIEPAAVAIFSRLLTLLNIDPELANTTAQQIVLASPSAQTVTPNPAISTSNIPDTNTSKVIGFQQVGDLLAVPGWSPELLDKAKSYVVFLPHNTPINLNTASPEVIAALLGLSLADANTLVVSRKSAHFRDIADASNRLPGSKFIANNNTSLSSNYFLVVGKVHMNRARLDMQALLERNGTTNKVLWILEN